MPRDAVSEMPAVERLNLAIGLVDTAARAANVIHELQLRHFSHEQCRFVVSQSADGWGEAFTASGQIRVARIVLESEQDAWWMETFLSDLFASQVSRKSPGPAVADSASPALTRQNRLLVQHLSIGGGALVVGLDNQADQQTVAGLFLQLAPGGVITHQLRMTDPSKQQESPVQPSSTSSLQPQILPAH